MNDLLPVWGLLLVLFLLGMITHPRVYAWLLGYESNTVSSRSRSSRRR